MSTYALAATGAAIIVTAVLLTKKQPGETTQPTTIKPPQSLGAAIGDIMTKITNPPPRGIRNNNPLNIEYNAANKWDGQTGTDGRFAKFSEPFFGIRAAARLLKNYGTKYGITTVRAIIARWAPATENNVEAYVNSVVKRSGKFPDMYLTEADYPDVIAAMIYHENGQQPYTMALIREATAAGFA